MSQLNINDLFKTINERNQKRLQKYDKILQQIHNKIKYNSNSELTYCIYKIKSFILGVPLYDIDELRTFLINTLKKNGFNILILANNLLFISWDNLNNNKKNNNNNNNNNYNNKNTSNFKSIDDYTPSGELIYNNQSLNIIKDKTNLFFN